MAQGLWEFEVTGKNTNGTVLYTGTKQSNVTVSNNTVVISAFADFSTEDDAKGTLSLEISAPKVGSTPTFEFELRTTKSSTAITDGLVLDSSTSDAEFYLTADDIDLAPGMYMLTIKNKDNGTVVGGQVLTFKIIEGETTTVSGSLDNGLFADVTVTVNSYEFTGVVELKEGSDDTYVFTDNSDYTSGITYQWFLNGESVGTDDEYQFAPVSAGYYCISCIATHTENSVTEVSSASVYVEYIPTEE